MNVDIQFHEDAFAAYAHEFVCAEHEQKAMLQLKVLHTQRVVQHMRTLVACEDALFPHKRVCLLAALYHDVARFEQFSLWRTFKDSQSVNHGLLGVKILKQQAWLRHEETHVRHAVMAAVAIHNRFRVPYGLAPELHSVCHALRDADKLDILRIMAEHFTSPEPRDSAVVFYAKDEAHAWSPAVVEAVLEKRLASYNDVVYVNDFKILLCAWFHELYFCTTRQSLVAAGHMHRILESIALTLSHDVQIVRLLEYMYGVLESHTNCAKNAKAPVQ